MKKFLIILMVVMFLTLTAVQPALAMSSACDDFASGVVVGSWSSVYDAINCAASDLRSFLELIGVF